MGQKKCFCQSILASNLVSKWLGKVNAFLSFEEITLSFSAWVFLNVSGHCGFKIGQIRDYYWQLRGSVNPCNVMKFTLQCSQTQVNRRLNGFIGFGKWNGNSEDYWQANIIISRNYSFEYPWKVYSKILENKLWCEAAICPKSGFMFLLSFMKCFRSTNSDVKL